MGTLGKTLKESRKNLNLTLRQVEEASGISNAYLSQLENDKIKSPSVNILSKLSSLYRVSLNRLLTNANIIKKQNNEDNSSDTKFLQKIAFSSEDLTKEEKKEVLRYLDYIKTHRIND